MGRGFIGDTVALGVFEPVYNPADPTQGLEGFGMARVGAHVEFPDVAQLATGPNLPIAQATIDVSASHIGVSLPASEGVHVLDGIFSGYVLGFDGKPNDVIKGVHIVDTNIEGLSPHSVLHNRRQILMNGSGVTFPAYEPAFIELSVQFRHPGHATASHVSAKHIITGEP